jgi:seryl-tRNA synthetase
VLAQVETSINGLRDWLDGQLAALNEKIGRGDAQSENAIALLTDAVKRNSDAISDLTKHGQASGERIGEMDARLRDLERDVRDSRHDAKSTDAIIEAEMKERQQNTVWRLGIEKDLRRVSAAVKFLGPANVAAVAAIIFKLYGV